MNEKLQEWGSKLALHRKRLNITQLELGEMTGLSDLTIRNIEKGKANVAVSNWLKVSDVLGFNFELMIKKMSDEARKSF